MLRLYWQKCEYTALMSRVHYDLHDILCLRSSQHLDKWCIYNSECLSQWIVSELILRLKYIFRLDSLTCWGYTTIEYNGISYSNAFQSS
jgi:hypothetical protein